MARKATRLNFEQRLFALSLIGALPASGLMIWLLLKHDYSLYLVALVCIFLTAHIGLTAYAIKTNLVTQFRTLTNLLEALSTGDYSLRGRRRGNSGALSELIEQINGLADVLTRQRHEVKETQLLLAKVITHIDVAVFTFNPNLELSLVNAAGASLYHLPPARLIGRSAEALQLDSLFDKNGQVLELKFPHKRTRFHVTTERFIENNEVNYLIFLTNVQALLREEERKAWQDLIRVISHEINNSLTPISSLSQTLMSMPEAASPAMQDSLSLIKERSDSLTLFIHSYRQLAKLPDPETTTLNIRHELEQVAVMFPQVVPHYNGEDSMISADSTQIRQLLINLIKNAQEAGLENLQQDQNQVNVYFEWKDDNGQFELKIRDDGPGLQNPENLFVPFYSTKPGGSGIGLLLCQQIAEVHGGRLGLDNAPSGGCEVTLSLPSSS